MLNSERDKKFLVSKKSFLMTLILVTVIFLFLLVTASVTASVLDTGDNEDVFSINSTHDKDGDGINDTVEVSIGTNESDKYGDFDNDGLYDFEEYLDLFGSNNVTHPRYKFNDSTTVGDVLDIYDYFGLSSNKTGYIRDNSSFTDANGGFTDYLLWNVTFTAFYAGGSESGNVVYSNNILRDVDFSEAYSGGSLSGDVTYADNVLRDVDFRFFSSYSVSGMLVYRNNTFVDTRFESRTGSTGSGSLSYLNNTFSNVNFTGDLIGGSEHGVVNYTGNNMTDVLFIGENVLSSYNNTVVFSYNMLDSVAFNGSVLAVRSGDGMTIYEGNIIVSDPYDSDGDSLTDANELFQIGTWPGNIDTDSDGLNDSYELKIGTVPTVSDTDGDGLNDGYELLNLMTNPKVNDTDGDGLSDGWEAEYNDALGVEPTDAASDVELAFDEDSDGLNLLEEGKANTDPTSNDTDGDGLPDGWEVRYENVEGVNPVLMADDTELALDGENDGLNLSEEGKANTDPTSNDTDGDGLSDGWEVEYKNIPGVDPTVAASDVELALDGDGDGLNLSEEFRVNTDPTSNDTDGDGLGDGWELRYNDTEGVNPVLMANSTELALDGENDGLNLSEEGKANTDPTSNDTDGDGLSDGDEVLTLMTDPTSNDTDGDGWSDGWEARYKDAPGIDPVVPVRDSDLILDTDTDGLNLSEEGKAGSDPTSNDTDGDGLSDSYEVLTLMTNPVSIDTDNDGANDSYELEINTDPLDNDTDGDGLIDGSERIFKTNPLSSDTDNDGIPDGFEVFGDQSNNLDPNNASDAAEDPDMDGLSNLLEYQQGTENDNNDTDGDGLSDGWEYRYRADTSVDPTVPATVPQLNFDTDRDGLTLAEEGMAGTDPNNNDTDGDGLSDWWEYTYRAVTNVDPMVQANSTQLSSDTDMDGLTLAQEGMANTDPDSNDTDMDKLSDGVEVSLGTNPTDNDTDSDGLNDSYEIDIDTNPLNNDTDADGLNDSYEIDIGTDPLDNDTDNDGIPDGFEVLGQGLDPKNSSDANNDPDGDELNNLKEYQLGTNHTNNDTDADGLNDSYEIDIGTDPLDNDTDNDGLNDSYELDINTDPLDNDTDNDEQGDGFEHQNGLDPNDPSDAVGDLDKDGLSNLLEFQLGSDPLSNDTDSDGLKDYREYELGTSLTDNDTDADGLNDSYEVLILETDPKSNDTDTDGLNDGYEVLIIETDPKSNDTDADGIPDLFESQSQSLDPKNASDAAIDFDSDGLSNLREYQLGTNYTNSDTDGDGLGDGWEVMYNGSFGVNVYIPATESQLSSDVDNDGLTLLEEAIANTNPDEAVVDKTESVTESETMSMATTGGDSPGGVSDTDEGFSGAATIIIIVVVIGIGVLGLVLYFVFGRSGKKDRANRRKRWGE